MSEKRRPALLRGNYLAAHLWLFTIVLPVLGVIDAIVGEEWWAHWALLGWGAVVLVHAFFVFGSHRGDHAELADEQQRAA